MPQFVGTKAWDPVFKYTGSRDPSQNSNPVLFQPIDGRVGGTAVGWEQL
jgi:hypothetical protein